MALHSEFVESKVVSIHDDWRLTGKPGSLGWYSSGKHRAPGKPDMNRAGTLALLSLFGSLVLASATSLAQNTSERLPSFPPLQQPAMPPLPPFGEPHVVRVTRDRLFLLGLGPACGPVGIAARTVGQLDSLPSRIVQLTLKNTSSVAIISERITVRGVTTRGGSSPALQQAYARNLEIEGNLTVEPGQQASVYSLLTGFSDAKHIELNSVTYADGSSWQPVNGEACIVAVQSR